uniref:Reverse transcriptase domain-containing protein n=1 Tax=Oncorhynchus mykiss TaxID=8022 RepID=A0A8K9XWG7_ONCMY
MVLGGDWNCTVDFTVDSTAEEPHLRSATCLSGLLTEFELSDVWRVRNATVRRYTWIKVHEGRVSTARLDRLYVSEQYCSRVGRCAITPVGFSDHHIVTVDIHLSCPQRSSPYWYFNVKLLHDVMFCDRFLLFWGKWRVTKGNFESLRQWWEFGKAQIRVFYQQYTALSQIEVKETIKALEQDIKSIELKLLTQNDPGLVMNLQDKRHELRWFLHERVKGALIRSRFASLKDMDAPSPFFNLGQSTFQRKQMLCLHLPDGKVTTDDSEMRQHAVDFYSALYKAEDCDSLCTEQLLHGLPQLGPEQRVALDSDITQAEPLASMVYHLSFISTFGGLLRMIFMKWCVNLFMGVLFLYPVNLRCFHCCQKKGDLALIKNWRPVALLCAEYKIVSKRLSNRLKEYLGLLIHKDRVDHQYLFKTMKAFGFGDVFLSWMNLLYAGASCMVKVGGGLSCPIPVQRGIRQGCPISGQLYSLVIEPMLCFIRARLTGFSVPGVMKGSTIALSAYADDLTVFITDGVRSTVTRGASDGVRSTITRGASDGVRSTVTRGASDGVRSTVTRGASDGVRSTITRGASDGVRSTVTRGASDGVRSTITRGASDGVHSTVTRGASDGVHSTVTRGASDGVRSTVTRGALDGVRSTVTRGASDGVRSTVTRGASDGVRSTVTRGASDGVPPRLLGGLQTGSAPRLPGGLQTGSAPRLPGGLQTGSAPRLPGGLQTGSAQWLLGGLQTGSTPRLPGGLQMGSAPRLPGGLQMGYAPRLPGGLQMGYAPRLPGGLQMGSAPRLPGGLQMGYAPRLPGGLQMGYAPRLPGGLQMGYAPRLPGGLQTGSTPRLPGGLQTGSAPRLPGGLQTGSAPRLPGGLQTGSAPRLPGGLQTGSAPRLPGGLQTGSAPRLPGGLQTGSAPRLPGGLQTGSAPRLPGGLQTGSAPRLLGGLQTGSAPRLPGGLQTGSAPRLPGGL